MADRPSREVGNSPITKKGLQINPVPDTARNTPRPLIMEARPAAFSASESSSEGWDMLSDQKTNSVPGGSAVSAAGTTEQPVREVMGVASIASMQVLCGPQLLQ